jgi:hypothetical protein
MKNRSLFWPLVLIAAGVVWLLVSLNVIPSSNLWALTHIWPYVLISLGLGLLLGTLWRPASGIVAALVVIGAVAAIFFAPQLGWASGPDLNLSTDFGGGIRGSGKIVTETRDVHDFQAISITYPAEVVVEQGTSESVKVEADDNFLPQLTTEVRDGTLVIKNNENDWSKRVDSTKSVKITITVKDLNKINFSSAGSLLVDGLKTDDLQMVLSGAGEVTFKEMEVHNFVVTLSGAGNIKTDGAADDLTLTISGFGGFEGKNLKSLTADVRISGAGNATVNVQEDLKAHVSGAGSIDYYGSPTVAKTVTGAGSVNQAGD